MESILTKLIEKRKEQEENAKKFLEALKRMCEEKKEKKEDIQ